MECLLSFGCDRDSIAPLSIIIKIYGNMRQRYDTKPIRTKTNLVKKFDFNLDDGNIQQMSMSHQKNSLGKNNFQLLSTIIRIKITCNSKIIVVFRLRYFLERNFTSGCRLPMVSHKWAVTQQSGKRDA